MNMPLATVMRAVFIGWGLGYNHSPLHPLLDPVPHNAIRIVDLDTDKWWEQLEERFGKRDLERRSYVVQAWNCMKMDDVLAGAGTMSMRERLLVCHFLELGGKARTYPDRSVAVATTHYAQMVWL